MTTNSAAEEHLYWGLLHVRWDDDVVWRSSYRRTIASLLPAPVRWFVPALLRRGVRKALRAHGLGRHRRDEIAAACARDLDALAELLGDRPFLLGDAPTSYDCSVYAMIAHLARTPGDHPLLHAVRERPTLLGYGERMDARIGWSTAAT